MSPGGSVSNSYTSRPRGDGTGTGRQCADGVLVTLPEPPSEETIDRYQDGHGVDLRFFDVIMDSDPRILQQVTAHVGGAIRPKVSGVYPLSGVQDAVERSQEDHVRANVVNLAGTG
jgi:hypothetical protein